MIIILGKSLSSCPKWWQNMIAHLITHRGTDQWGNAFDEDINKELANFNGKFIDDCKKYKNGAVIFNDDNGYALCCLFWE